ncbi:MAG: hypothetical protein HRT90_03230 [Candidatus Margulisbacteria bacterium]|nr:hypothetical protein [Candidatus Margulisiibacteriota bacterium]
MSNYKIVATAKTSKTLAESKDIKKKEPLQLKLSEDEKIFLGVDQLSCIAARSLVNTTFNKFKAMNADKMFNNVLFKNMLYLSCNNYEAQDKDVIDINISKRENNFKIEFITRKKFWPTWLSKWEFFDKISRKTEIKYWGIEKYLQSNFKNECPKKYPFSQSCCSEELYFQGEFQMEEGNLFFASGFGFVVSKDNDRNYAYIGKMDKWSDKHDPSIYARQGKGVAITRNGDTTTRCTAHFKHDDPTGDVVYTETDINTGTITKEYMGGMLDGQPHTFSYEGSHIITPHGTIIGNFSEINGLYGSESKIIFDGGIFKGLTINWALKAGEFSKGGNSYQGMFGFFPSDAKTPQCVYALTENELNDNDSESDDNKYIDSQKNPFKNEVEWWDDMKECVPEEYGEFQYQENGDTQEIKGFVTASRVNGEVLITVQEHPLTEKLREVTFHWPSLKVPY